MKNFKIKIGKTSWKVNFVKAENIQIPNNEYGCTLFKKGEIYIDKDLKPDILEQTLLHELFHAILCESGFEIKTSQVFGEMYETFIDSVSRYLDCFKQLYKKE